MKFNTFLFRDLDNNYVMVIPDEDGLDFQIVKDGMVPAHELPLNQVDAVEVHILHEDEYHVKALFRMEALNNNNEPVDLATLSEEDEDAFRNVITRLYDLINDKCSMQTQQV